MRASLNEIATIEKYLLNAFDEPGEHLLFGAKTIVDHELKSSVSKQKLIYEAIRLYGRKLILKVITKARREAFTNPKYKEFQNEIDIIFKS